MKNILNLLFCLCIVFSSFGFAESIERQAAKSELNFASSKTVAENEIPNVFRPIGNWFKRIFGRKGKIIYEPTANVNDVSLSQNEIVASCSDNKNSCSNSEKINVSTAAVDPENDPLIYRYKVGAGKIVGEGAKVVWDLSGTKPGTYTITAGVEDGCGVCGRTVTKEVKVIECPNCN